ncbi:MAG: hypothetical protein RSB18_00905 [Clostridia bacterium]
MKKTWKSALAALITLVLCVAPVAGMAQGTAQLETITVGNLTFALGENKGAVDASIILRAGADLEKEQGILDIQAVGGANQIGRMQFAYQGGTLKGVLDGLKNAYGITKDEIVEMFGQMQDAMLDAAQAQNEAQAQRDEATQRSESSGQVDPEALEQMMSAYTTLLQTASELPADEKVNVVLGAKMEKALGESYVLGTADEAFDVLGEKYTGKSFHATIGLPEMDKIIKLACDEDKDVKAFYDAYFNLINEAMPEGVEVYSIGELYAQVGMQFNVDITGWEDAQKENMRLEMLCDMTATQEQEGAPVQMKFPMTIELSEKDGQTKMAMSMEVAQDGTLMRMGMKMDGQSGTAGQVEGMNMVFDLDVAQGGETVGQMTVDARYALANDGGETADFGMKLSAAGAELMDGRVSYAGTLVAGEGTTERAGRVTVRGTMALNPDALEIGFDVGHKSEPMTDQAFEAINVLPIIKVTELDEEKLAALRNEAQAVAIRAMGAILQTPGVAEMLSEAFTDMQTLMASQALTTSNYQADDAAYGQDSALGLDAGKLLDAAKGLNKA